jgi:hypothetical protein
MGSNPWKTWGRPGQAQTLREGRGRGLELNLGNLAVKNTARLPRIDFRHLTPVSPPGPQGDSGGRGLEPNLGNLSQNLRQGYQDLILDPCPLEPQGLFRPSRRVFGLSQAFPRPPHGLAPMISHGGLKWSCCSGGQGSRVRSW